MIWTSLTTTVLLALASPLPRTVQVDDSLTPGQMEQDLFTLSEALLQLHSGRMRYATEEELDQALGDALFECSEDRSRLEFYRCLARVLSTVRCGHTQVRMTGDQMTAALEAGGLLPFDVHLDGERAWILRPYDPELVAGAEISAINGHTIGEIRDTAFAMMSGDGFIETGKERRLEEDFSRLYVLLVQTREERGRPYEISLVGGESSMRVNGLTPEEFSKRREPGAERELISFDLSKDDDLGWIRISQFGDRSGEASFPDQLERAFQAINASGVGHLAVDLRGNGGGNDDYGARLVSYMADREFRYFERIEVTPDYDGPGGVVEEGGRRLVTAHRSLSPWKPAESRFEGEVFLLEDGWTFSTAADVATVAHHNGFATLVGQESGGGYDGNTSGSSHRMELPASGIRASIPMWMYTTANVGHGFPGRGAIPHHPVRRTIADALGERDAEMDRVRELIQGR